MRALTVWGRFFVVDGEIRDLTFWSNSFLVMDPHEFDDLAWASEFLRRHTLTNWRHVLAKPLGENCQVLFSVAVVGRHDVPSNVYTISSKCNWSRVKEMPDEFAAKYPRKATIVDDGRTRCILLN